MIPVDGARTDGLRVAAQSQLPAASLAPPNSSARTATIGRPRTDSDLFRFQPTVISAVRRYPVMVVLIALLAALIGVGSSRVMPKLYRAEGSLTVPGQLSLPNAAADQYLDSQVLLLRSQEVAQRATNIANGSLNADHLGTSDFWGGTSKLTIVPPETSSPGTYGASIIGVSFTWPDARIAKVAVDAVLRAFDDARYASIKAGGDATIAGIDRAIIDSKSQGQRAELRVQRTQALVKQQIDLEHHPTLAWAVEPQIPINDNSKRAGAIGLLLGAVVGATLALARATRRPRFADSKEPAAVYGVPLLGQIPPLKRRKGTTRGKQDSLLPMAVHPNSSTAESFRFVAGHIARLSNQMGSPFALDIVSPVPGVDKSMVVANAALALAEGGTRVLAVDADPRRTLTSLLLSMTPPPENLEEVLTGKSAGGDQLRGSPGKDALVVLAVGPPWARMRHAANARELPAIIDEAKAEYDVLLIDSPALLTSAEALDVEAVSDAVIVVTSSKSMTRDHLETASRLNVIGSKLAGYVYVRLAPSYPRPLRRLRWRRFIPSPAHGRQPGAVPM